MDLCLGVEASRRVTPSFRMARCGIVNHSRAH